MSLVIFYGSCDWTQSREETDVSDPNLIPVIPPSVLRVFDKSYLFSRPDIASSLLSPGVAPDGVLRDKLPERLVMMVAISCLLRRRGLRRGWLGSGRELMGASLKVWSMVRIRSRRLGKEM